MTASGKNQDSHPLGGPHGFGITGNGHHSRSGISRSGKHATKASGSTKHILGIVVQLDLLQIQVLFLDIQPTLAPNPPLDSA